MSILNPNLITVDAILTKKGRETLAKNDGSFRITQFALSDDEIDYSLYNPDHPDGSAFYGEAIEKLPLMEAFPDESQIMKYKLVTLPRGTSRLPILSLGYNNVTLKQGASITINPQTLNYLNNNTIVETNGYVMTISDIRLLSNFVGTGIVNPTTNELNNTSGTQFSKTQVGTSFTITATTVNGIFAGNISLTTTLTVIGRDSGARITIPLIIEKINN